MRTVSRHHDALQKAFAAYGRDFGRVAKVVGVAESTARQLGYTYDLVPLVRVKKRGRQKQPGRSLPHHEELDTDGPEYHIDWSVVPLALRYGLPYERKNRSKL